MDMEKMQAVLMGGIAAMIGLVAVASAVQAYTPRPLSLKYFCPYCGEAFDTEEERLDHILEEHTSPDENYYSCPYCGQEFGIVDELFAHIASEHRETSLLPAVSVALPEQVDIGELFNVSHSFPLEILRDGDYYTVAVELGKGIESPQTVSYIKYVDANLYNAFPLMFSDCLPLDHSGLYTYNSVAAVDTKGAYSVISVAKYQRISDISNGLEFDAEYAIWNIDTGKTIYVGEKPEPPPPPPEKGAALEFIDCPSQVIMGDRARFDMSIGMYFVETAESTYYTVRSWLKSVTTGKVEPSFVMWTFGKREATNSGSYESPTLRMPTYFISSMTPITYKNLSPGDYKIVTRCIFIESYGGRKKRTTLWEEEDSGVSVTLVDV